MKSSILFIVFVFALTSCEKKTSESIVTSTSIQAADKMDVLPVGGFIPSLQEVSGHLEANGQHFSISDVDGELDAICNVIDQLTLNIDKKQWDIPDDFSFRNFIKALGLSQITAKGQSCRQVDDHWHNRSYYSISGKRTGILSILGDKAKPFVAPTYAPADADFVFETQLNLKQMKDLADFMAKSVGPNTEQEVKSSLERKFMNGSMTLADMLGKFDVHLSMALTIDESNQWLPESKNLPYPVVQCVIRLDNAYWLWKEYGKEIEKMSDVREEKGLKYLVLGELKTTKGNMSPLIIVDQASDQIWFALSEDSYKACQSDRPKLQGAASFQTAISGLPEKGNTLAYVSPEFCISAATILQKVVAQEADDEWGGAADEILSHISKVLTRSPSGYAFAMAHQEKGVLLVSNAPIQAHGSVVTGSLPLYLTASSTLFVAARSYKEAADRSACILNIRNLQQAVRANQNINQHNMGDPIPWEDILGEDKFLILPKCPCGTDYILSKIYPKIGATAAKCPNSKSKDHHPKSTEGW